MSYVNMDHAGWVESQVAAMKRYKMTKRDREAAAEHKGWHAAPDKLNEFQRRSFSILTEAPPAFWPPLLSAAILEREPAALVDLFDEALCIVVAMGNALSYAHAGLKRMVSHVRTPRAASSAARMSRRQCGFEAGDEIGEGGHAAPFSGLAVLASAASSLSSMSVVTESPKRMRSI